MNRKRKKEILNTEDKRTAGQEPEKKARMQKQSRGTDNQCI